MRAATWPSILQSDVHAGRSAMPTLAKFYIATVIGCGLAGLMTAATYWQNSGAPRFLTYLVMTMVTSGMKVILPGIEGTLSVAFLPVLVGIAELTWPETIVLGAASFTMQCIWRSSDRRGQLVKSLFNVGNAVCSVSLGYFIFHWPVF